MVPLIRVMDHPRPLDQVKIGVLDDPQINAASEADRHGVTLFKRIGPRKS